jgi:HAD superfamily hydrolase (TIGR01509 family)
MFGLPEGIEGCLFDLDGVLTRTATAHAAAWKETFDDFLRVWAGRTGEPFVPFDIGTDYLRHVDGKPRLDGVRSFLAARGIRIPEGLPGDPAFTAAGRAPGGAPGEPDAPGLPTTVHALGTRKNDLLLEKIEEGGVEVFPGSVRYLRSLADAGVGRGVVSASANCAQVLRAGGIADLLPVRVDGVVAEREGLRGKPAPDTFLAGARALGVSPPHAAVFEDALAGVEAGRAGGFGHVVGVDRVGAGHADALRRHGADVVVGDLAELLEPSR